MNIGIIGSGTIVPDFLNSAKLIDSINILAICGRETGKARLDELATAYSIPQIFLDYDQMLDQENIQVIYVAVPNHLHFDFAKKALLKHKHVILEKPFTVDYEEAVTLANLAIENNLFLFEAISNQYFPNYEKIKTLLPGLGAIKIVQLNFSQYSRRYDLFKQGTILPVFDPEKAGGALMDLNVYNLHFVIGLFGKPEKVEYHGNIERGIDTSGILFLKYPDFQCVAIAAKDCKAPLSLSIQGDKGYVYSSSPANVLDSFEFFCYQEDFGNPQQFSLNQVNERLYYELLAFEEMFTNKDYPLCYKHLQHSLDVMEILTLARNQTTKSIN